MPFLCKAKFLQEIFPKLWQTRKIEEQHSKESPSSGKVAKQCSRLRRRNLDMKSGGSSRSTSAFSMSYQSSFCIFWETEWELMGCFVWFVSFFLFAYFVAVCSSLNFNTYKDSWNHHLNQDTEQLHQKISLYYPFTVTAFAYPEPLAITDLFSIMMVLPFWDCNMNRSKQYVAFETSCFYWE